MPFMSLLLPNFCPSHFPTGFKQSFAGQCPLSVFLPPCSAPAPPDLEPPFHASFAIRPDHLSPSLDIRCDDSPSIGSIATH
jgi:hypothetical protein